MNAAVVAAPRFFAGNGRHSGSAADPLAGRARQLDRNANANRAVAGAFFSFVDRSCLALPLRRRPAGGALAMGQRGQRLRGGDVDCRVVSVLLVSHNNFANYNATYGSLGAVVGLMIWLWISTIVVLLGAELNAEIEHQTARDSTIGGDKPLGARGA